MSLTRLALIVWLTVMWVVLWREVSPANVLSGAAIGIVVIFVFPPHRISDSRYTVRPLRLLLFIGYFFWQVLVSNLVVAREILTPRDRVRAGIVAVPVTASSNLVIMVVANAISLTPGTLTLEVRRDPPTLYVHVLHLHDLDRVRDTIRKMQRMAVLAIGSREAVAQLDSETPTAAEDLS
jgi:multicomponent Na+:H+ antiporter subunit E